MGIFDQIKNAFSKTGEEPPKPAGPHDAPPASIAGQETPPAPESDAGGYTVQSGDTLWKIAEEKLGDGNRYGEIFEANRDILHSPDHILPGQELKLP